jgi:hypothetical protein
MAVEHDFDASSGHKPGRLARAKEPDFVLAQLQFRLDAVEKSDAARAGRKIRLHGNDPGPLSDDALERRRGIRVEEGLCASQRMLLLQ